MASKKKLLQAAAGSAGSGGSLDIDECFSCHLYDGTGSTQTITNGIDLSGEGGLVWLKRRDSSASNNLEDTARGAGKNLVSDSTAAEDDQSGSFGISAFNSNGFSLVGAGNRTNASGGDYVSWTFRKAPRFFDVVTYTGNGVAGRTVSHNLGADVGMLIVKKTNSTDNWFVWHRGLTDATYRIMLNSTSGETQQTNAWNSTAPSSTEFTLGDNGNTNASGDTYVAYLFAHNDGDGTFGPSGDQDVIKCGSYTGNGSTTGPEINLGFEPQWLLIKDVSTSDENWQIFDQMRGMPVGGQPIHLYPNSNAAEGSVDNQFEITSTGFKLTSVSNRTNASGRTYIYMAIRRGPLAEPESATDVFAIATRDGTEPSFDSSFPVDFALTRTVNTADNWWAASRLNQGNYLQTNRTNAEASASSLQFDYMDGWNSNTGANSNLYAWMWKRAPSYFDVVAYSGTGSARTVNHNLGVAPEMMWIKRRSAAENWAVYHSALGNNKVILLQSTGAAYSDSAFNNTTPTNSVFSVSNATETNASGSTYIAYLFATVAGVSKVGSWTMASGNNNIDCGFTSGARFVLIKDASASGAWIVWDSVRGIVAGNDPYLELNSTNAEYTTYDYIDPLSSGFTITSAYANFYAGNTYIFYAIA